MSGIEFDLLSFALGAAVAGCGAFVGFNAALKAIRRDIDRLHDILRDVRENRQRIERMTENLRATPNRIITDAAADATGSRSAACPTG
jgi:hypothetical protein